MRSIIKELRRNSLLLSVAIGTLCSGVLIFASRRYITDVSVVESVRVVAWILSLVIFPISSTLIIRRFSINRGPGGNIVTYICGAIAFVMSAALFLIFAFEFPGQRHNDRQGERQLPGTPTRIYIALSDPSTLTVFSETQIRNHIWKVEPLCNASEKSGLAFEFESSNKLICKNRDGNTHVQIR